MKGQSNARVVMAGAAGLVILSAFMPWVSLLGYSRSGIDYGDGTMTLIVAIIGLVFLWRRWLGWVSQFSAALVVVAISFYDMRHTGNLAAIGLYLTFAAGVAWGCAAGYERRATVTTGATQSPEPPERPVLPATVDEAPAPAERPPVLPMR